MHSREITCLGFYADNSLSKKFRLTSKLFSLTGIGNGKSHPQKIYRSMGINKFLIAPKNKLNQKDKRRIKRLIANGNPEEILKVEWHGVLIGDLFYDWHLRRTGRATLDFKDANLEKDFQIFISNLNWWNKCLKGINVEFVFISHAVYLQGLIGRLGVKFNAKVFVVGDERFNQISLKNLYQDSEFIYYQPQAEKQFGYKIDISRSKSQIRKLINGSQEVDDAHKIVTGFNGTKTSIVIKGNKPIRILVAAHCFSDAAHLTGTSLFPDYKIWLDYLAKYAASHSEYEWYVKEHPGFFETDKRIFDIYCEENPHIIKVSKDFANPELFNQGINVVLSVNGTISFEAALNNILVINCSTITPHMNYDFAKQPKSIEEYEYVLTNLNEIIHSYNIRINDVEHFYDLHHLRRNHSWLYRNHREEMLTASGGYGPHLTDSRVFTYWLNKFLLKVEIEGTLAELSSYLLSDQYLIPFVSSYEN